MKWVQVMFNPITIDLISRANALLVERGVSDCPEPLSVLLSRAAARQSTFRLERLDEAGQSTPPVELRRDIDQLLKTGSLLISLCLYYDITDEDRSCCGLVAAHVYVLVQRQSYLLNPRGISEVMPGPILPCAWAMLLFLIGKSQADAIEVSKEVPAAIRFLQGERPVAAWFLRCLSSTVKGDISFSERSTPPEIRRDEWLVNTAEEAVWRLFGGLILSLCGYLLGQHSWATFHISFDEFRRIISGNADQGRVGISFSDIQLLDFIDLFYRAADYMRENSTYSVCASTIGGTESGQDMLNRFSKTKAILWDNQRRAVSEICLIPGKSAVVAWPTGAGKSTVIHMRIISAISRGKSAVLLVPTHSLERQHIRDLSTILRGRANLGVSILGDYNDAPTVAVTTPESFLSQLYLFPEKIENIEVLLFDEAHMMHSEANAGGRSLERSVAAMSCILAALTKSIGIDILLVSAMMSKTSARSIADWLHEVHGRHSIVFDSDWKPTRQIRAAVVYSKDRLEYLRQILNGSTRRNSPTVPVKILRSLTALPYLLCGLKNKWTLIRDDYLICPALPDHVPLAAGTKKGTTNAWLTSNRNAVSAHLAAGFIHNRAKTLIACRNPKQHNSVIQSVSTAFERLSRGLFSDSPTIAWSNQERTFIAEAAMELGSNEAVLLPANPLALPHNALLLPQERYAVESAFRREDGCHCIVASPTLSQGVNLPVEVLIVAGDDRHDDEVGRIPVVPDDLLNAIGRAGRAGSHATGLAIVVPGQPVGFMSQGHQLQSISDEIRNLLEMYQLDDRSCAIIDPIGSVIAMAGNEDTRQAAGPLLFKATAAFGSNLNLTLEEFRDSVVKKTLWYKNGGVNAESEAYISSAHAILSRECAEAVRNNYPEWVSAISLKFGVSSHCVSVLDSLIRPTDANQLTTTMSCLLLWAHSIRAISADHRCTNDINSLGLNEILAKYCYLDHPDAPASDVQLPLAKSIDFLYDRLKEWMAGSPIMVMQESFIENLARNPPGHQHYSTARSFISSHLWTLSYTATLLLEVAREILPDIPASLETLPGCMLGGYQAPEELLLENVERSRANHDFPIGIGRVSIHKKWHEISNGIAVVRGVETWDAMKRRILPLI